jgi:hypothetical protein
MDWNLYYDARASAGGEALKFSGATLEQWRARGHDVNTVIADPLFAAPDKNDFRMATNSPALKIGFKEIDLSQVGVREKEKRE